MEIKTLYRYVRENSGTTVSIEQPEERQMYEITYRIIADEGRFITNDDENYYTVIDTDDKDGWKELSEEESKKIEEEIERRNKNDI